MAVRYEFLIKHGTIVDGSGAPGYKADLRVRNGRIARIAPDLAQEGRERVIDATGCYVTPGFIESHNHWDAGVFWAPLMEPASAYGITTSINGNCGFSAAPMVADPAIRREMMDIFNYFEDIPFAAQESMIPWNWHHWSEYRRVMERQVKVPVNFAAFCGHLPLRLCAMGLEAWDRAATPAEITTMCGLLDDALAAGALGLSSNLMDRDRRNRPIMTKQADEAEWRALMAVMANYPEAIVQVIIDTIRDIDGDKQLDWLAGMAQDAGARLLWLGMPNLEIHKNVVGKYQALHDGYKAQGLDFWTSYGHVAPTVVFNMNAGLMMGQQGSPVWQELTNAEGAEAKEAMLTDPVWLARARKSWEGFYDHSYLHDPEALTFLESESGYGPTGLTLGAYMKQKGIAHPSDAFADWLLYNGCGSVIHKRAWTFDEDVVLSLLRDPRAAGNASDNGAHGQTLCGAGDNAFMLSSFVRDRKLLTIEEAIHVKTGKNAECFRLADRGYLREGLCADIVVFDLAEVERRPLEKIWDVPDGEGGRTYRYSRAPAPMRLTLCNGVPTFDNGAITGRFPGRFIGPDSQWQAALAAE